MIKFVLSLFCPFEMKDLSTVVEVQLHIRLYWRRDEGVGMGVVLT